MCFSPRQPLPARPILPLACSSISTPFQLAIAVSFADPQRLVILFLSASSNTSNLPKAILTLYSALLRISRRLVAARVGQNVMPRTQASSCAYMSLPLSLVALSDSMSDPRGLFQYQHSLASATILSKVVDSS